MNRLSLVQKARVVAVIVEGNSIRSTKRTTGVAKNSVIKLLFDLANAWAEYYDMHFQGLRVRRLQCDEIWAFAGANMKKRNARTENRGAGETFGLGRPSTPTQFCVSSISLAAVILAGRPLSCGIADSALSVAREFRAKATRPTW